MDGDKERKYGVIREQGEFMEAVPLTDEENAAVNEAANSTRTELHNSNNN